MRIGILGGAFDPPHNGHEAIAEYAEEFLTLDKLILMVTHTPPHKKPCVAPAADRLAMARILAEKHEKWSVSDQEVRRGGLSHTIDTVRELKEAYQGDELFWLVGSDGLLAMPEKWKDGYDVLDLITFAVYPRPGFPLDEIEQEVREKIRIMENAPVLDVSSTRVREQLERGEEVIADVPEDIRRYIREHALYQRK